MFAHYNRTNNRTTRANKIHHGHFTPQALPIQTQCRPTAITLGISGEESLMEEHRRWVYENREIGGTIGPREE